MSRIRLTSERKGPELATGIMPIVQSVRWCSQNEYAVDEQPPHDVWRVTHWPMIFMTQDAYTAINGHAESDLSREVGGMLLGQARQTEHGYPYVIIETPLPAEHVEHGPAHLTFTSDTLTALLNQQEADYPESQILGWFHTHPGLGVFLSSYDTFLHRNFFPQAWHVALVVDPRAGNGGFFRYEDGDREKLNPQAYVGFYEMIGDGKSVMAWGNLTRDAEVSAR